MKGEIKPSIMCGDICRQSRKHADKKVSVVAKLLGCDEKTLRRYEKGVFFVPEYFLVKMSEIYNDPYLAWNYWVSGSLIAKHYDLKTKQQEKKFRLVKGKTTFAQVA